MLEGGRATKGEREREGVEEEEGREGLRKQEMRGEIVGNAQADRLAGKGEGARLANGVRDAQSKGEMATKREMIFYT